MSRFIASFASLLFVAATLTLVSGCERPVTSCAEFDPPPGKEPGACPHKAAAVQAQPAQPARYCYSSLGQVDCYAEPQPGRPGYLGSTEAPPPTETPVKAKGEKAPPAKPAIVQPAAAQPAPAQPVSTPAQAASPATAAPTPLKPASAN